MRETDLQSGAVIVTGGSGFVGASVIKQLVRAQRDVHLVLRPGASLWRIRDVIDQTTVHQVDIQDMERLLQTFRKVRPVAAIHLATYGAYADQASPRIALETNVMGSFNVFEAAIETEVELVVNVGSSSEYGTKLHPMSEHDPVSPDRMYGVAKVAQSLMSAVLGRRGERRAHQSATEYDGFRACRPSTYPKHDDCHSEDPRTGLSATRKD